MRTHIASEPPIICKHQAAVRAIGERVLPRTRIVRRKVDKRVKEIRLWILFSPGKSGANTASILGGGDFTVTRSGAFLIPNEYAPAFPTARIWGIDPENIVHGTNPQVRVK